MDNQEKFEVKENNPQLPPTINGYGAVFYTADKLMKKNDYFTFSTVRAFAY